MNSNITNINGSGNSVYPLTCNEQPNGKGNVPGKKLHESNKNSAVLSSAHGIIREVNHGSPFCSVTRGENIGKHLEADEVQNRLTSNMEKTADNFLNQFKKLEEQIGKKFTAQLQSLKNCHKELAEKVKDFWVLSEDKRFALGKAIADINSLVYRLNNESVGGINKSKKSEFFDSIMHIKEDAELYETVKKDLESTDPLIKRRGEVLKKECTKKVFPKENFMKKNLDALKENLDKLEKFSESPKSKNKIEKMLNLIQQCCLNAWVFNDVVESLEKIGFKERALKNMAISSESNDKMKKLNKAARNTTMFKERKINGLIEVAGLTEIGSGNKRVKAFLDKWGNEKIGFRGRHGVDKNQKRVPSHPIGNTKNEKDKVEQNGSLYKDKKFISVKSNEDAIKGSVVPNETANLKTLPDAMLKDLKDILNTRGGQKIVNLLKKEGFIEVDKDGVLQAKPSFASFINDAGLPTYCSVSGTTGEIVSVLHCTLKDENGESPLREVFENLLKIAEGNEPNPPPDFSTYFAPVATFMEVGHFHTTGEVLGGFYSVAVAEKKVNGDEKIDADQDGFQKLLNYFNSHQKDFLGSLDREEEPSVNAMSV